MSWSRFFWWGAGWGLLAGLLAPAVGRAQAPTYSLTVSPSFLTLAAAPGDEATSVIKIQNNSGAAEELAAGLMRLVGQNGDQPQLEELPADDPFSSWVTMEPAILTVEPGRATNLNLTIRPPATAALGYYYAVALRRTRELIGTEAGKIAPVAAIPILLEVTVPGAKREVKVVDFAAEEKLYDFLPVRFRLTVRNTGNVHVAPRGNIFVTRAGAADDLGAQPLALLEINQNQGGFILPGTERSFEASWEDGFPHYEARGTKRHLVWDFSRLQTLRYGQYTGRLVLAVESGSEDIAVEGLASFWVVPWQLVVAGILIFLFIYNLKSLLARLKRGFNRLRHRPS